MPKAEIDHQQRRKGEEREIEIELELDIEMETETKNRKRASLQFISIYPAAIGGSKLLPLGC